MKKSIVGLMLAAFAAIASAQNLPYQPVAFVAYTTTDGHNFFPAAASSGGLGTVNYTPPAVYITCPVTNSPGKYGPCNFGGGGGGNVTWPPGGQLVISSGNNTPQGLAAINGDCLIGVGTQWAVGACPAGMTWPAGSAGVPNYNGANAWGATYNAANPIPANFISVLNQNTTGTAGGLTGTPLLPNGTTAFTQNPGDTSAKVATDQFVMAALSGGSMVWPAGGAGIPNYSGSNAWGASYSASNPIPANFISVLNQNTTGTAGGLLGGATGSVPYQLNPNLTGFIASPTTSGHTFALAWQPSGAAIAPVALDLASYLASPPSIGSGTANSGAFTNVSASGSVTVGISPPTACGTAQGCIAFNDGSTAGTPTATQSYIRAGNSGFVYSYNGGAEAALTGSGAVNTTITVSTTTVPANGCLPTNTTYNTATMSGVTTGMTFTFTPSASVASTAGWTPSTPGLYFNAFPTANTLNWQICNGSGSGITPGASTTWNVSAK